MFDSIYLLTSLALLTSPLHPMLYGYFHLILWTEPLDQQQKDWTILLDGEGNAFSIFIWERTKMLIRLMGSTQPAENEQNLIVVVSYT